MRLLLAGLLTVIAGSISTADRWWVVVLVGLAMIAAAVYRDGLILAALRQRSATQPPPRTPTHSAERVTRERWRETRERR